MGSHPFAYPSRLGQRHKTPMEREHVYVKPSPGSTLEGWFRPGSGRPTDLGKRTGGDTYYSAVVNDTASSSIDGGEPTPKRLRSAAANDNVIDIHCYHKVTIIKLWQTVHNDS